MFVNDSDNIWTLQVSLFAMVAHFLYHLFFVKEVVEQLPKARIMSQGVFLSKLRQDSSSLVAWKSMLYFPRNRSSAKKAEFKVLKLQVKLLSNSVGNTWESGSSAVNFQSWKQWKTCPRHVPIIHPMGQKGSFSPPLMWQCNAMQILPCMVIKSTI